MVSLQVEPHLKDNGTEAVIVGTLTCLGSNPDIGSTDGHSPEWYVCAWMPVLRAAEIAAIRITLYNILFVNWITAIRISWQSALLFEDVCWLRDKLVDWTVKAPKSTIFTLKKPIFSTHTLACSSELSVELLWYTFQLCWSARAMVSLLENIQLVLTKANIWQLCLHTGFQYKE